ncbi:serine hydrolase domain-containing protein [uncultured Croceitalea sp.]|uniref:serine hydrolase domain-containing protein n=1 Tax=uncultured Croceitalea sp. TaxID=1798908 RepID=UPI0033057F43
MCIVRHLGYAHLKTKKKVTKETIFEAASLSKPLFAYFALKQMDKGLIGLDTPLYEYVDYPDIQHDEHYKMITARMVLSHTTGLPNWRPENDTLKFIFTPGDKYGYSGEGFQYLARAVAKVNHVDRDGLFEIFKQDIATPLNAGRLYYNWNDDVAKHKAWGHKDGEAGSNGPSDFRVAEFGSAHNLHTDIDSYARFIGTMISGAHISDELYAELLKKQVVIPNEDYEKAVLGNTHWGLAFGMKNTSNGWMYSHGGNNGDFTAFTIFYPDAKFGLVLLSNSEKIMFSNFTNEITSFLQTDLHMDMKVLEKILAKYE